MKIKKAEMGLEVLIYILMAIIFVTILIFGFNKIFLVKDTLSEHQRIEMTNKLKEALEFCEDPLNSGNLKNYEIKGGSFNSVCVLGEDFDATHPKYGGFKDWIIARDAGENVILLDTNFVLDEENKVVLKDYNLFDTFKLSYEIKGVICWFDKDNDGKIDIEIECG